MEEFCEWKFEIYDRLSFWNTTCGHICPTPYLSIKAKRLYSHETGIILCPFCSREIKKIENLKEN